MNLFVFAGVRYESALFLPPFLALLFLFRMVNWATLRPYAFVYALTPAYLLPRIWQAVLRGSVPPQEPGVTTFSVDNFFGNASEYFEPILSPWRSYPAHSAVVIALGVVGCLLWLRWIYARVSLRDWKAPRLRASLFVASWMLLQAVIVFAYTWGHAQKPPSARLVLALDTFFSFGAAWVLTLWLGRFRPFVGVLVASALVAGQVPAASRQDVMNRLTQTRENATTWRFFEGLHEKRILIVTDRPNHFTIMDYGAMSFETARRDPFIFVAWERHLFYDIYLVQQIRLSTKEPLPGYDIWPGRRLETLLEFQNDKDVLVRISRVAREAGSSANGPRAGATSQNR
jgi:hypothetical protein